MNPRSCLLGAVALLAAMPVAVLLIESERTLAGGGKAKTITLTDKDNDGKVKAAKGDKVVVKLGMTSGTGYTWTIAKIAKDKLVLEGDPKIEQGDKDKKTVGGPVTQVFTFTAKAAGAADLELHYNRPFEKGKAPEKIFKINVQID